MKKRFIYYNGKYPGSERDVILCAANLAGSCGHGKISVHLANGITLEREDASEAAILTIRDDSYIIISGSSFEKMLIPWENCPTIYVLETEVKKWKEEWRRNRQRLKKRNIFLLGIKDLPMPKHEAERIGCKEKVPISGEFLSYQRQKQGNVYERNELSVESPQAIKCNKNKTALVNVHTNKKGKYNGKCVKTFLLSLISVGIAFYAHDGIVFPHPFLSEYFIDCAISLSILCFTWCVLHITYLMVEETVVGAIKSAIDRKWKVNTDEEIIVAKVSEMLTILLILLFAPLCVFFSI